jgi:hypothetical protein
MHRRKVFGIGFHKTGTKSLGAALDILGYRTCGPFGTQDADIAETALARAVALVSQYDAFQDNPWPLLFKELDTRFPDSRFILTICPSDEWIERAVRYFGTKETPMRRWIYGAGSPIGHERQYVACFEAHTKAVMSHFQSRHDQLLVMPLIAEPKWQPLCAFLGMNIPQDQPFPHKNRM